MNKTIGIFAHVDAGKTTFSEQLLYHTNAIKTKGRVDHQSTFLDSHHLERQRGITVFADQANFTYNDSSYYLIDTPGHADFSSEMERAVQVMDFAIVILSAAEGIEGHTETVWNLLKKHHVPVFFFINKIDRTGANVQQVIDDIVKEFTEDVLDFTDYNDGEMTEEMVEFIAERDEKLLEYYIENGYDPSVWLKCMQEMVNKRRLFPCAAGSALQDIGVKEFLEMLDQLTVTSYSNSGELAAKVYKIRYDEAGTRWSYIKIVNGQISVREEIEYGDDQYRKQEKITQMVKRNGQHASFVKRGEAGELVAVTGLTEAFCGDGLGALREKTEFELVPALRSKVALQSAVNIKDALRYFKILDAEDPALNVVWDEKLQEIHLHIMGKIQLEILEQIIPERFGMKVRFEPPRILYKETIETNVIGYGHFEPLRHYAEVHLRIERGERNSGIRFESECHPDDLSVSLQNLIKQHIFEREHHGLLTGSPLTDVKFTLLTGRDHNKHTSGGDFREATFRALRQGLEKAKNILLEPYYSFKIKTDIDQMGRVLSDIQAAYGTFDAPLTEGDKAIITGKAPVATFMDYSTVLASFTHGKGSISLNISGYDLCHNAQEVIDSIGYNKNADPLYTSSSVFCAKGESFIVSWDEAEKMMHCL